MAIYVVTDAGCDLSSDYVSKQHDFEIIPMDYTIGGKTETYTCFDGSDQLVGLFDRMRGGETATTAQINLTEYLDIFTRLTQQGHEVLYISLSSGLSGTFQTAMLVRSIVMEKNPAAQLFVVDSLCASSGQGLLVHFTLKTRDEQSLNAEQLAGWVTENRQHINHWFTVDKLDYLHRGGRVSRSTAIVGDMMKIKPLMNVNFEGKLIVQDKVMGRKRSLKAMAEQYLEKADRALWNTVFIAHGDCAEDAAYLTEKVKEINPDVQVLPLRVGSIIGCHTGPGVMTLFFWAANR